MEVLIKKSLRAFMIIAYLKKDKLEPRKVTIDDAQVLQKAIWIDLLCPTHEEEVFVEKLLELDVPTIEEMQEIELSSRLYKMDNALFMTATVLAKSETLAPKNDVITLIVTPNKLITVRYVESQSFSLFISRLTRMTVTHYDIEHLVIEFLESAIDRLADILERIGHRIDEYSQLIFNPQKAEQLYQKLDYKQLLQTIGMNGDLNTKSQESLVSFNRLITFFEQATLSTFDTTALSRLATLNKDINSLSNHANFLSNKVIFLLEATLGMVNIEQNNIIKIFSIASVILLPPTLIASIYGMNFHFMPELRWYWGYPLSIGLMLISAWFPYMYFKKRKWL